MKTYFLIAGIAAGLISSSCDSCSKKQDTPDSTAASYTDTTAVQANADTTDVSAANAAATPSVAQTHAKTKNKSAASKTDQKSMKGYSAPDGTDAENHDGDQYTRNDEKPRPTGPPIK